ncbi:hypothetical protein KKF91_02625 [Myxococcota bacterium]|nr:hypothetical protein [Myxococcota bacterium]MBU1429435.1 hypothetical protein [Myxococcota bacterium]MBU1897197.1 hypothetical protein [Myxococcota bacterium]
MSAPEALRLRLTAQGLAPLASWIFGRLPEAWGPYLRPRLLDFGAESLVFEAHDPRRAARVVIKLPFIDYTLGAALDLAALQRRRAALAWEIEVLERLGAPFPALVDTLTLDNPLLPRSLPPSLRRERVAVMAHLEGIALAVEARREAQLNAWPDLEALLARFVRASLALAARIEALFGPQALYADLKLENATLCDGEIRFFDASSVVDLASDAPLKVSPLYLDPVDYGAEVSRPTAAGPFFRRGLRRCVAVILAGGNALPGQPCALPEAEAQAAFNRLVALIDAVEGA